MKKIKNLFIYLLVLTMLFGVKINAAESTDINQLKLGTKDHLSEKIYIKNWLTLNGLGTNELSNPSELLGLDGSIAAVCFDLNESGYIIINSNNLDIMEYSFTAKSPFKGDDKVYYNGPLQYYTERDGNVYDIKTKEVVETENLSDSYLDVKISEVERINKLMQINTLEPAATTSSIETDYLNYSLEPWASSYYCHPDSASILLKYLDMHKNPSFLPIGYSSNTVVQDYLTNTYIFNGPTTITKVVNGGEDYVEYEGGTVVTKYTKGMAQYLIDRNLSSSYSAVVSSYSFGEIKTKISQDFPVVIGVPDNGTHPDGWSSDHAVVVHGYFVAYDGVPFVYVNDTFGHNNISINASSVYFPNKNMWFIN